MTNTASWLLFGRRRISSFPPLCEICRELATIDCELVLYLLRQFSEQDLDICSSYLVAPLSTTLTERLSKLCMSQHWCSSKCSAPGWSIPGTYLLCSLYPRHSCVCSHNYIHELLCYNANLDHTVERWVASWWIRELTETMSRCFPWFVAKCEIKQ